MSSHIIGEIRHTADWTGMLTKGQICREFSVAEKAENVLVIVLMYGIEYFFHVEPEKFTGLFVPELLASGFLVGVQTLTMGMVSVTVSWKNPSTTVALVCTLLILFMLANLPSLIAYCFQLCQASLFFCQASGWWHTGFFNQI
ncbi:MAG: hypothetical protein HFI63_08540 [Lachnospiraceae bacterium]|nr:hypothetical protein [Lachnospiraceae bacterium]